MDIARQNMIKDMLAFTWIYWYVWEEENKRINQSG